MDQKTLAHIITDWENAPNGHKTECLRRWAKVIDCSPRELYRKIRAASKNERDARSDKGQRMNKDINDWTRVIWGIKNRPPEGAGVLSSWQAVKLAVSNGAVPAEAGEIPVGTYNRIAIELGYKRTSGRYTRFQAKYANLVHQFDATTSKFFYIAKKLPNGDRLLKMHRPGSKGTYKNKPIPMDRERPIIYAVVDDFSGAQTYKYVAALGEAAVDGIDFLMNAWALKEDEPSWFRGLPTMMYIDNGPLTKATAVRDFLKRLDVSVVPRTPYNSKAGGKIERPWRTLFHWFEKPFFVSDWKNFEITLSELNRRLDVYKYEYAQNAHRYEKDVSRIDMWWKSINQRNGVIDVSLESIKSIFQRYKRHVKGGFFSLKNHDYEVKEFDEGVVWVYEGVFDDRLVVEDQRTFKRYEVKAFKPLSFGQRVEKVVAKSEKIVEESREKLTIENTLYKEKTPTKISKLPVRQKEKRTPEDLLTVPAEKTPVEDKNPFFMTPRERYEWLLDRKSSGKKLPKGEIEFMEEFERTPLYKQLAASYQRLQAFNQKRAAL